MSGPVPGTVVVGVGGVSKWAAGPSYGPVLQQTQLYILGATLDLNPILEGKDQKNPLQFHVVTGFTTTGGTRGPNDGNVHGKDQPATLPRVDQLIIISRISPWCTIVKNEHGVTIGDVCSAIYKDYTENSVTEAEFAALNARAKEQLKRTAASNFQLNQPQGAQAWGYYTPAQPGPDRYRRVDWLRDRVYFEALGRDENYAKTRLGFKAPNIFIMELTP
ncbi:hypothetical protein M413DRAFT_438755 [Hebeloma cylindrosporum]|uniref:DUF6699 domain-containing protein n=1 Tax=Hebeloma cylindrosporum TaxID=76867 RepID=A0A0C3CLI9_HEBCY|nr:hypothetical protein M413DRAFT_438755 [Hebeloma cylindrosporum h7]